MEISQIIFLLVGAVVGAVLFLLFFRKKEGNGSSESLLLIQKQIENLSRVVDVKLGETHSSVRAQMSESQRLLQETNREMTEHLMNVTRAVTETKEGTKQVFGIAEQLKNLEKVLTNQKQRGNLGEASLQLVLENILPPDAFSLQYGFANGDKVDAVIKTKDGFIPVDAKFSLDNYNRILAENDPIRREELEKEFRNDLKKRIDETAKYIRPKENTLPFAIMFIPAEGIYYDLLVNEVGAVKVNTRNLLDYSYRDKNVIIVSPTTFAAYLQSVLYGFRAFKIEESAKEIGKRVEELGRHLKSYEESFGKLGNTLGTTVSHYNSAAKELGKIDKDVLRITGASPGLDIMALDKPTTKEEVG